MATGLLHEKQKLILPKEAQVHKLFIDCVTRWNSTFHMLQRICEQKAALHAVATDASFNYSDVLKPKLFTYSEQSLVQMITFILEPFKKATEMLSSETKPTLSMVAPILIKLSQVLEIMEEDPNTIKKMKQAMAQNLEKRKGSKSTHLLASSLDPRTKKLLFLSASDRNETFTKLKDTCIKFSENESTETKIKSEPQDILSHAAESGANLPALPSLSSLPSHVSFETEAQAASLPSLSTVKSDINTNLPEDSHFLDETGDSLFNTQLSDATLTLKTESDLPETVIPDTYCTKTSQEQDLTSSPKRNISKNWLSTRKT